MNLDDTQRNKVAQWIAQGLKLAEIQNRIATEMGIRMTYMDVRLLVDDLKLTPKDAEPAKPSFSTVSAGAAGARPAAGAAGLGAGEDATREPAAGGVSVTVDQVARPGAFVSGKVTFSDGKQVDWFLDQSGRIGLIPPNYRPSTADWQQFETALKRELVRLGFLEE